MNEEIIAPIWDAIIDDDLSVEHYTKQEDAKL